MLKANLVSDQQTRSLIVPMSPACEGSFDKEEENDDCSESCKDVSTRYMNYEQVMKCLGIKTLAVRKAERRRKQEE